MKREKIVFGACLLGTFVNLLLFFIKLYVSLSSNSISIFSDCINNLSDSLSCLLATACMVAAAKFAKAGISYLSGKIEQVLSFILALIVAVVGFSFAYSSLERFMYPTPVWFAVRYFIVIAATAVVKLVMFFFYLAIGKKTASPVIKVMATDSIMDVAITAVTLITFTMTMYTNYTVDAAAGLIISIIIIIEAIKLIKSSLLSVLNIVKKEKREAFKNAVEAAAKKKPKSVAFSVNSEESIYGYVTIDFEDGMDTEQIAKDIKKICLEKTGIEAKVIFDFEENENAF